jgi:hypothetical protein
MLKKKKFKPSRKGYVVILIFPPSQTLNMIDLSILFGPFILLLAVCWTDPAHFLSNHWVFDDVSYEVFQNLAGEAQNRLDEENERQILLEMEALKLKQKLASTIFFAFICIACTLLLDKSI